LEDRLDQTRPSARRTDTGRGRDDGRPCAGGIREPRRNFEFHQEPVLAELRYPLTPSPQEWRAVRPIFDDPNRCVTAIIPIARFRNSHQKNLPCMTQALANQDSSGKVSDRVRMWKNFSTSIIATITAPGTAECAIAIMAVATASALESSTKISTFMFSVRWFFAWK